MIPSRYPPSLVDDDFEDTDQLPYVVVQEPSQPFHIGQSYSDKVAAKLACRTCGGEQFSVGHADYFTALRCDKCGWERCLHEG